MKKTTSAIVIINPDGDILACHGTGRPWTCGYDFPKGCVEAGEEDMDAAIRELKEETGLSLEELGRGGREHLKDCGVHSHSKEKNIHIFLYKVDRFPSLEGLKCTTYFEYKGCTLPEMNGYRILHPSERDKFNKVLWNKFEMIDKINRNETD